MARDPRFVPEGHHDYKRPPTGVEALTTRELQALFWAAQGFENPQIARCMGIARDTVRNLLQSAYGKLGVTDRTQAVVAVLKYVKREEG